MSTTFAHTGATNAPPNASGTDLAAVLLTINNKDDTPTDVQLLLAPDTQANVLVLSPGAIRRAKPHLQPLAGTINVAFGPHSSNCKQFTMRWTSPINGPSSQIVVESELPLPFDGILPRPLFHQFGIRLSGKLHSKQQTPDTAPLVRLLTMHDIRTDPALSAYHHRIEQRRVLTSLTDNATRMASYNAALRDFSRLLAATSPNPAQMQQLLEAVPEPEDTDTFELYDVLCSIIARNSTSAEATSDPVLKSYYQKLAHYADLAATTPEHDTDRRAMYGIMASMAPQLITSSNYMDYTSRRAQLHGIEHRIDVIPGCHIPRQPPERINPAAQPEFQDWYLNKVLANNLTRLATPEEARFAIDTGAIFPHLRVAPSEGAIPTAWGHGRYVLNMHGLKSCTRLWHDNALPSFNDLTRFVRGKRCFSTLDLSKMYYQIPLERSSQKYTAHRFNGRIYVYQVTPQGERNSASTATRLMRFLLTEDIEAGNVIVYIDDVIVAATDFATMTKLLQRVFQRLAQFSVRINAKKTKLGRRFARFLGYLLSEDTVEVDILRYTSILAYPTPTKRSTLKSFIGLVNFFSRFLPDLASTLKPLQALAHEDSKSKFNWLDVHQRHFDKLRGAIVNASALYTPDYARPFHLYVDSSSRGVGSVLCQQHPETHCMVPICFGSKMLNTAQSNYSATTLELYGIWYAVTHIFHNYVACVPTHIYSDHRNVTSAIDITATNNKRRTRWIADLMDYPILGYHHVPGVELTAPDVLSRLDWSAGMSDTAHEAVQVVINYMQRLRDAQRPSLFALPTLRSGASYGSDRDAAATTINEDHNTDEQRAASNNNIDVHDDRRSGDDNNQPNEEDSSGGGGGSKPAPTAAAAPTDIAITLQQLRSAQQQDELCQQLRTFVDNPSTQVPRAKREVYHTSTRCSMHNGVLMYTDFINYSSGKRLVVVLPTSLQQRVIHSFLHPNVGRLAAEQTFLQMRRHYWFPNMLTTIRQTIGRGNARLRARTRNSKKNHGTLSTSQPSYLRQELGVDLIDVSDGVSNYRHALVAVYSFSRYAYVIPLRTKAASEVAAALLSIFADRHVPHTIRSDRGNEFAGEVNKLAGTLGFKRILTAPHTSTSNGITERVNTEVQANIRRWLLHQPGTPWSMYVPAIHYHLRSTISSSTGFSPYELEAIRAPVNAPALAHDATTQLHTFDQPTTADDDFVAAVLQLAQRRTAALANDVATRDRRLVQMNRSRKPLRFNIGDYVMVSQLPGSKTASALTTAFEVVELLRNNTYRVINHATDKTYVVSIANMTPADPPPQRQTLQPRPIRKPSGTWASVVVLDNGSNSIVRHLQQRTIKPVQKYRNQRPGSARTQQRWSLTSVTVQPQRWVTDFEFEITHQGHLILPQHIAKLAI